MGLAATLLLLLSLLLSLLSSEPRGATVMGMGVVVVEEATEAGGTAITGACTVLLEAMTGRPPKHPPTPDTGCTCPGVPAVLDTAKLTDMLGPPSFFLELTVVEVSVVAGRALGALTLTGATELLLLLTQLLQSTLLLAEEEELSLFGLSTF